MPESSRVGYLIHQAAFRPPAERAREREPRSLACWACMCHSASCLAASRTCLLALVPTCQPQLLRAIMAFNGLFKFLSKPPVDSYPLLGALCVGVALAGITGFNKMKNDPELGVSKSNPYRFLTNEVEFREKTGANRGVIDRTLRPQNFCTSPQLASI